MRSIRCLRRGLFGLVLAVGSGVAWAHEEAAPASAQAASEPVVLRAALSHAAYAKGSPPALFLKVDYAVAADPSAQRPPLNIALVLDRSGSMAEDRKFSYTLEAAREVIANLSDHDVLAIVAFGDRATVLAPAGRVVNKQFLLHRLTEIAPAGYTDISSGLLEGIAQIDSQRAEGQVEHVLVLTDGMANRGVTGTEALRQLVTKAHARGIGVSTFGCGTEFNEKRLAEMAAAGGGRYIYVKSPEQIPTAFVEELHGLLQAAVQNATIEVAVSGAHVDKVFEQMGEPPARVPRFDLGNLRAGERGTFLMELKPSSFERGSAIEAEAQLTFDDPQAGDRVKRKAAARATFSENSGPAALGENTETVLYGRVFRALENAEEAAKGLDVERSREARTAFDQLYEQARQQALRTEDQELLNEVFLLKHFMEEIAAAEKERLLHGHREAQKKFTKESDYQRYLLMHHR